MEPTERQLKNRQLALSGNLSSVAESPSTTGEMMSATRSLSGASTSLADTLGKEIGGFETEQKSVMDRFKEQKRLSEEAAKASEDATRIVAEEEIEKERDLSKRALTAFEESRRGFATNNALFRQMTEDADKRVKLLERNRDLLLAQGKADAAERLDNLLVKEQETLTNSRTRYLDNLFKLSSELRSESQADREERKLTMEEMAFETPTQKSARELSSKTKESILAIQASAPDAGITATDDYETAIQKYRNSSTYKRDVRKAEAEINKIEADAQEARTKAKVSGSGGLLNDLPVSIQNRVLMMAKDFGASDIVKKYNATVDAINIINGIDVKTQNPADHQTIVYAFAKSLDPESVVREGEYATIKKYAQSLIDKYKKEINQAINGTGFLSEDAIKNIQSTMNNNYRSRKPAYDAAQAETSRVINNVAGREVSGEVLIDYTKTLSGTSTDKNLSDDQAYELYLKEKNKKGALPTRKLGSTGNSKLDI